MIDLIIQRHPLPQWATFTELRNAPGGLHSGAIDVAAFNIWPSGGGQRVAYEIKSTRQDFKREIDNPEKRKWVEENFHQTYFVCEPKVCKPEEIPEGWGLLVPTKKRDALRRSVVAKHRDIGDPSYWLMLCALRRACEDLHAEKRRVYKIEGKEFTRKEFEEKVSKEFDFLKERVDKRVEELFKKEEELNDLKRKLKEPLRTLAIAAGHYNYYGDSKIKEVTVEDVEKWLIEAKKEKLRELMLVIEKTYQATGELLAGISGEIFESKLIPNNQQSEEVMGLIKLYGYDGEAEVLGTSRRVSFDENGLHIHGLTLLEANELVGYLATGKIAGREFGKRVQEAMAEVLSAPQDKQEEPKSKPEPAPKSEPEPEPERKESAEAKEEKSEEEKPRRRRGRRPKKDKAETEETKEAKEEPTDGKSKGEDWVSGEGEDAPNGVAGISKELMETLKSSKKLRDIIGELADAGFDTQHKLLEICKELKDDVPVLSRVANLEERVPRIAESIDITE